MKEQASHSHQVASTYPKANKQAGTQQILQKYKQQTTQLQATEEEDLLQGKFETTQLATEEQKKSAKPNNTGLPDNLKSGIENMSGYSMDDVKVHYNSDKPAQLQAHAYAQGTDIHVAPGQEKHLPHEAWHVVQQKQGRVKPTMQMKGKVNVNDDVGLEKEADVMGARALQMKNGELNNISLSNLKIDDKNVMQQKSFDTLQRKGNYQVIQLGKKGKVRRKREKEQVRRIEEDQAVDPNGSKMKKGLDDRYVNEKLEASEVDGGHARDRHAGKNQAYLQGRNIRLATTFETIDDQDEALLQLIEMNKPKISAWISEQYGEERLIIEGEVDDVNVRGEIRQSQQVEAPNGHIYQNPSIARYVTVDKDVLTNVRAVLERFLAPAKKKGETRKWMWRVVTFFPYS